MALLNLRKFIGAIAYPPGSIYCSTNNIDPTEIYGGSWERFAQGRVLVGVDENDADFATVGLELGEKEHQLIVNEIPTHAHSIPHTRSGASGSTTWPINGSGTLGDTKTGSVGGDQPHNNIQPSITVYIWRRLSLFPKEEE